MLHARVLPVGIDADVAEAARLAELLHGGKGGGGQPPAREPAGEGDTGSRSTITTTVMAGFAEADRLTSTEALKYF